MPNKTLLPLVSLALAGCTLPPPTMMAPLDDGAMISEGSVAAVGHAGVAIVPDQDGVPAVATGGDLEVGLADGIGVAVSGGLQNQGYIGQIALRARIGGTYTEGWTAQLQVGAGYAQLVRNDWFTASPAIGGHVGMTGSAPLSGTGRAFVGAMVNLSYGLDNDGTFVPFTYVGTGLHWDIPVDDSVALVIGVQAYGLGIVIPVSPGIAAQLGVRFGKAPE